MKTCTVINCDRPLVAKGYCHAHYTRERKGSTLTPDDPITKSQPGDKNPNWRGGKRSHPLYEIYHDLRRRCTNPGHSRYSDYGGRGISVHPEWGEDFWAFVRDVGERPEGKTKGGRAYWQLDRINNDGNYEPGNVRWANPEQQVRNRREFDAGQYTLRGSAQKTSKLTEEQVLEIVRRIPEMGRGGQSRLAEEYEVSLALINRIWKGRIWNWLTHRRPI